MPIQPINYAAIPLLRGPMQGLDFGQILRQGMQLGHEPGRLLRERQQQELSNALRGEQLQQAQMATPYIPRQLEADIKNKEFMNELGGHFPAGETGELLQAYRLKEQGHPVGEPAWENLMAKKKQREENVKLSGKKAGTTNYKLYNEIEEIRNNPYMDEQEKEDRIAMNNAAIAKNSRTGPIIERLASGEITEEGLNELIQPAVREALTEYTGPMGKAKLIADKVEAGFTGKSPPRLLAHKAALATAKNTANNLRISIKESVSPKKAEELLGLIADLNFATNPDEAIETLMSTARFYAKEMQILRKHSGVSEKKSKPATSVKKGFTVNTNNWDFS